MTSDIDWLQLYDMENYLFAILARRFNTQGTLSAIDVLRIANWKAPRARRHIARRLCALGSGNMEAGAATIARAARPGRSQEEQFHAIIGECGFALPMGTAILTVLDESQFSVYDRRVCDELGTFHNLLNVSNLDRLWTGYVKYVGAVRQHAPQHLSLRDADRWLWARSAMGDLERLARSPCS